MKKVRSVAFMLAGVLVFYNTGTVYAAEKGNGKEEVVYIMTDSKGSVEKIDVVNIFGKGAVTDYGDYESVQLMNSLEDIKKTGDKVTFEADQDRVYYQGTMEKNTAIPWNISLRYFLDGEEITPDSLAGKSGKMKICFQVTQNDACQEIYYEKYALQAAFTLDMEHCENIVAEDATEANVGTSKQLTYTILPGKGIDTVISMDVKDFQMDPVTLNGIALNLNVDIDDEELKEKIGELVDATNQLNDGAFALSDGSKNVQDGGTDLKDGTEKLYNGVSALDDGVAALQTGILTVQNGLDTLNQNSASLTSGSAEVKKALHTIDQGLSGISADTEQLKKLTEASGMIRQGIAGLNSGITGLQEKTGYAQYQAVMGKNGLDVSELPEKNTQAAENLKEAASKISNMDTNADMTKTGELLDKLAQDSDSGYQEEAIEAAKELQALQTELEGLQELKTSGSSLTDAATLLQANNAAYGGMESYLDGIAEGINDLHTGAAALQENYGKLDEGITTLSSTMSGMLVKLTELSQGINTLASKYDELDNGLNNYTEGVAAITAGYSQLTEGVSALASGSKELLEGAGGVNDGASQLLDGISELCDGAGKLADGTNEMNQKSADMDEELEDKISDIMDSIGGGDFTPVSFTSEKNRNVESVQFVIKTDAIEKEEQTDTENEQEEKTGFWYKLVHLFL